MRHRLASYLIVAFVGGVLGWLAHSMLERRETRTSASQSPALSAREIAPSTPDPAGAALPQATPVASPELSDSRQAEKSAEFVLAPGGTKDLLAISPKDREATGSDEGAREKLLKSKKIWCRFSPGNGAWLKEDNISMYELAYQGGPFSYESIDLDAETARMTGSEGATGSLEGTLDVRVIASRSGLHFSAFNSRGELLVTTVFGTVDKQGRHLAVMATHGTHPWDGSFQIYGACVPTQ